MSSPCWGLKPRYRDFDLSTTCEYKWWASNGSNPLWLISDQSGQNYVQKGHLIGYDTPNFHRRQRKGELLCKTPYSNFRNTVSVDDSCFGYIQPANNNLKCWSTGSPTIYSPSSIPTESLLTSRIPSTDIGLVQDAAAKIQSEGHDTLTFLAELGSVKKMFTGLVKRLVTLDKRTIAYRLKDGTNDWLEARYGWRLLISDLQDLNEAIKKLNRNRRRRFTKSAKIIDSSSSYTSTTHTDGGAVVMRTTITDTYTTSIIGSVTADVEIPIFSFNPFVTAWELVPYSFVLDWLIGVGRSIAAISLITTSTSYAASVGYLVKLERKYSDIAETWINGASGDVKRQWTAIAELKYRYPATVPYLPHFRVRLNTAKIIDLVALLYQRK